MNIQIMNAACLSSSTLSQLMLLDESESDIIVTKTCTLLPYTPESEAIYVYDGFGAINNIGLANKGFNYYKSFKSTKPYTISVTGTIAELTQMLLDPTSTATYYEINLSCPNTDMEHITIDQLVYLSHIRPYGLKLPPLSDIDTIKKYAKYINEVEPYYVVCSNTLKKGIINNNEGCLSGKYLKPISLWNVKEFRKLLNDNIKIYGCGGIITSQDISDYIKAGASSVQIGTSFIEEGVDIFNRLKKYLKRNR